MHIIVNDVAVESKVHRVNSFVVSYNGQSAVFQMPMIGHALLTITLVTINIFSLSTVAYW